MFTSHVYDQQFLGWTVALEHYATEAAGWDYEGWAQRRAAEKDPAE